jgi:hypothetical protein
LAEGERRRDAALALLALHRDPTVRRLQRAYLLHLLTAGPSTIDPIRAAVPIPGETDPRCVGAAVRGLATLRLIRRAGLTCPARHAAHGRDLPVWEIADRAAALVWLADHPGPPEPGQGEPPQREFWGPTHH